MFLAFATKYSRNGRCRDQSLTALHQRDKQIDSMRRIGILLAHYY
jgi:hypothetical protein